MNKSGTLEFTVDLPNLTKELMMNYAHEPAAWGVAVGLQNAIHHLMEIGKIAIDENNTPILLRLFAVGIIENPRPKLKKQGLWDDKWNELAERLGAGDEGSVY